MNKSVYVFGGGVVSDDPRAKDKKIVGGKGANLAEIGAEDRKALVREYEVIGG